MANACTSQQKDKLHFEVAKNSAPRPHKVQYRNWHYISERLRDLHTSGANKTPELGIFWTGKQTNCKTCQEIFTIIFIYIFIYFIFICWKFRRTKYTQIAQVSGSVIRVLVGNTIQFLCTYTASEGKDFAGVFSSLLHINSHALLFRLKNLQQDFPEQSHN